MSMRADHASISHRPIWRRRQFWHIALPIVAVACAVVAGFLVYDAFVGSKGVTDAKASWNTTYKDPPKPKTVKLDPAARSTATKFLQTAVARKHLAAGYAIAGPGIREGMTMKQWLTGTIPVVPYLVNSGTSARMAVDQSYKTSALLEIAVSTPHQHSRIFFASLIKRDGKWLVNSWTPRGSVSIPTNQ
jgi:hypothetical protein